jgi:hypothetical protein
VSPDNPDDKGVEVFHKLPRSNLIAFANAIETASQIKRLVVRHTEIDALSGTYCKTPLGCPRLRPFPTRNLTFIVQIGSINAEMAPAFQALRLTPAHDL